MSYSPLRAAALLPVALGFLLGAVPLAAQGTTFGVNGELRLRTESALPATTESWDNWTLMRTRVGLLATVNPTLRAYVQLQDARVFGDQPTTLTGVANAIDLHQGYLEAIGTLGPVPVGLRAGRQEIALGNERLVGAVGWSNTGRSFDAARLTLGSRDTRWSGGGFLATVHEGGARYGSSNAQDLGSDHWLAGAHGGNAVMDGYLLYDRNAHYGVHRHVDRATLGGRLQLPAASRVAASLEGARQTGSQQTGTVRQDIDAWFAGTRVGVNTGARVLPYVGVGVDYLSGDEDITGPTYGTFNTLYHTGHKWYGYLDLFTDPAARTRGRGLVDAMASARAGLGRAGTLEIDLHRFQLANTTGLSESEIGWELDLTYPFRVAQAGRFTAGYSFFRNGPAAAFTGLGEEGKVWHWGFLQASVPF
jgi:hypothetical protein